MVLAALLLLVLAGALSVPFVYETRSLWYKFGVDKTLLRTGQMFGLAAIVLLLLQPVLAVRLVMLDRLLGLDRLLVLHRLSGVGIAALACTHAVLVLLPEGLDNLPIGRKYWPEMVGMGLLALVLGQAAGGVLRNRLGLEYGAWRRLHRPLGYVVFFLALVHVLNVSDSFGENVPRLAVLLLFGGVLTTVLQKKFRLFLRQRSAAEVVVVECLTDSVIGLQLRLPEKRRFGYLPGQFAFLAFRETIGKEPHPFTLASAPAQGNPLQFVIKRCGDWTKALGRVKTGDRVWIDGPYGLFSYLAREGGSGLLFIAGGIGITPMLSMLRQMASCRDARPLTLIWSNRRERDMFLAEELEELARRLPQLRVHLLYTRSRPGARRLDIDLLRRFTAGCDRSSTVFLCGPAPMMKRMKADCLALGFARGNIHSEVFGF